MLGERRNIFACLGKCFKTYVAVIFKVYSTSVYVCSAKIEVWDLGLGICLGQVLVM